MSINVISGNNKGNDFLHIPKIRKEIFCKIVATNWISIQPLIFLKSEFPVKQKKLA